MKNVEIYTLNYCPYCTRAKDLFDNKHIEYKEYDITSNEDKMRNKLTELYNIKTVVTLPQIIINGERIGGFESLKALDESGELDKLLSKE